jgi:hypothetical protein
MVAGAVNSADPQRDQAELRAAGIVCEPAELLAHLNALGDDECTPAQFKTLLRQLGGATFAEREQATSKLSKVGVWRDPELAEAPTKGDAEQRRRLDQVITAIRSRWTPAKVHVTRTAVREMCRNAPDGTIACLMRLLPLTPLGDTSLSEEVQFALDRLAVKRGAVEADFEKYLADADPARREFAAYVCIRRGKPERRAALARFLTDSSPVVRLRVAQGLLGAGGPSGIPVLIELVADPDLLISLQAEELLTWLAGDSAVPSNCFTLDWKKTIGRRTEADVRAAMRADWFTWWGKAKDKIDLARVLREPRHPGLLMVQLQSETMALTNWDGTVRCFIFRPPLLAPLLPQDMIPLTKEPRTGRPNREPLRVATQLPASDPLSPLNPWLIAASKSASRRPDASGTREIADLPGGGYLASDTELHHLLETDDAGHRWQDAPGYYIVGAAVVLDALRLGLTDQFTDYDLAKDQDRRLKELTSPFAYRRKIAADVIKVKWSAAQEKRVTAELVFDSLVRDAADQNAPGTVRSEYVRGLIKQLPNGRRDLLPVVLRAAQAPKPERRAMAITQLSMMKSETVLPDTVDAKAIVDAGMNDSDATV